MKNKLFIGGLAWKTDDVSLKAFFEKDGRVVTEAKVITDRETGRSRGFGFVTFATEEDAAAVLAEVEGLEKVELDGREIRVSLAEEKSRDK